MFGLWCDTSGCHYTSVILTFQWLPSRNYAYLSSDVLVGGRRDEREANEEDIRLRVGQGSQSVVVLLSCRVP